MSGAKLGNLELELKALKTVLSDNPHNEALYGLLRAEFFHYKVSKALFTRLQAVMEKNTSFPSWKMLITDSQLEDNIKEALADQMDRAPVADTKGDFEYIVRELTELANKRTIYSSLYQTQEALYDVNKTSTDIAAEVGTAILKLDNPDWQSEAVMGYGYNEESERVFNDIIYNPEATNYIKTGFKSFDTRSGGHQRGNLVLIGANSGGGKSQFALNLMVRQYLLGYNVVMASYEMNKHEIMTRLLAIISEVDMELITTKKLSLAQKKIIEYAWRKFNLWGAKNGNYYALETPTGETTISEVAYKYKSKKPTSIVYDYINLLTSKSKFTEAQWQLLGEIAKEGKVVASKMDVVVYLLVQINDQMELRYSKAVKDHANWFLGWMYDDEARANGFVTVKQLKARNAPCYDFPLITRFDIAQFRDPEDVDINLSPTDEEFAQCLEEAHANNVMLNVFAKTQQPIQIPEPKPEPEPAKELPASNEARISLDSVKRESPAVSYFNVPEAIEDAL